MADIIPRFFRTNEESWALRTVARLDWSLVAAVLFMSLAGLFLIYSAAASQGVAAAYLARQGAALAAGLLMMTVLVVLPYQVFRTYYRGIYLASVVILVAVLIFGVRLRGSRSWFDLQVIYLQPVEITRLALTVALASYVDAYFRELRDWSRLAVPFLMTGLHMGLILLQPDFSSTLVMIPMMLAILYTAGASAGALVAVVGAGALALGIPLASTYFALMGDRLQGPVVEGLKRAFLGGPAFLKLWGGVCAALVFGWWFLRQWRIRVPGLYLACALAVVVSGVAGSFAVKRALKDYQRKRLIVFVDPRLDPLGAGYNILQSEIAIGSGRFFGKGYLEGTQSRLGFLPEQHTDFIFSLAAEQGGFFLTVAGLGVYFWIVWRAFDIAAAARDRFGRFLASGLGAYFAAAGVLNIGMTMGLMPVTGVPLPFVSYGGSSLLGSYLAVGLLLSIHSRRYIL
jgi:rod shape determining protein RodA